MGSRVLANLEESILNRFFVFLWECLDSLFSLLQPFNDRLACFDVLLDALGEPFSEISLLRGFFIFCSVVCRDCPFQFLFRFRLLRLIIEVLDHNVLVFRHQFVISLLVLLIPVIFCLELLHFLDQLLDNVLFVFG